MSNPNDPAYPTDRMQFLTSYDGSGRSTSREVPVNQGGMTIRQRFVMAAMQGMLLNTWQDQTERALEVVCMADACMAEEARTRK